MRLKGGGSEGGRGGKEAVGVEEGREGLTISSRIV